MRMFSVLLILLMVSSIVGECSSYLRQIKPSKLSAAAAEEENPACEGLRSSYRSWGGVAVGVGAASGGSGLASAFPDNQTTRIVFGASSLVLGIVSAVSVFERDSIAAEIKGKNCK